MQILVVNDDGISSTGIYRLAQKARAFGKVTVVAPSAQCSAMARRITVHAAMRCEDETEKFGLEGVRAFSVAGTPADCVKLGTYYLCPEADVVFSGVNFGYNVGRDLFYSGTMGAALEGIAQGRTSIAYSADIDGKYDAFDTYFEEITKRILSQGKRTDAAWNVNFPGTVDGKQDAVWWDRVPDQQSYFQDYYEVYTQDGATIYEAAMRPTGEGSAGTDLEAVLAGHISVGLYHPSF